MPDVSPGNAAGTDYRSPQRAPSLDTRPLVAKSNTGRSVLAILAGVVLALPFVMTGRVRAAWEQIGSFVSIHGKAISASPSFLSRHEADSLNHTSAQQQSMLLLERAINHYDGAADEIASRADSWRGHLKLTPQM